ncbi:MAG: hypothetical protein ACLUYK_00810 [Eggerthella lenta]
MHGGDLRLLHLRWRLGGERPPKDVVEYPDREPDLTYEEACGYQWPLIYRLMGDWHQQHIDWATRPRPGWLVPSTTACAQRALPCDT